MKKLIRVDKLMKALRNRQCTNALIDTVEHEISYMTDDLIIPDNPTNGDMIKAMFPNVRLDDGGEWRHIFWGVQAKASFSQDWWNAPYKGEIK